MSVKNLDVGPRVELQLHEYATGHQYRELGVFVRFCIDKIERDAGRAVRWAVTIVPNRVCYCCEVVVEHENVIVTARGNGFDGAIAGWEAFNKIETLLQENHGVSREAN
jgi:hypothetical protein